jgi:hypothetical protein
VSDSVRDDVSKRPIGHNPGHARHDQLLVVRFGAGDATGTDAEEARALTQSCTDCAQIAADIRLLQTSMSALPTPRRTRNFRLTAEDAERLRGSAFDRFLRRLAMPQLGVLRPVAGVALALGLTITAVGAGLPSSFLPQAPGAPVNKGGQVTSAQGAPTASGTGQLMPVQLGAPPTSERDTNAPGDQQGPSAPPAPSVAATEAAPPVFSASGSDSATSAPTATVTAIVPVSPAPTAVQPEAPAQTPVDESADTTRLLLIYAGVTLAMVAFAVLLLGVYARRRTEDPLLR